MSLPIPQKDVRPRWRALAWLHSASSCEAKSPDSGV